VQNNNGRVSLSDAVVEKLEAMISGMKPGERLPTEKDLSEQFSVGRSTIRESMKVLSAKRMVVRRNEGTFVGDAVKGCLVDPLNLIISMQAGGDVNSLIELREILELSTIRMACQRATPDDIIELERACWMIDEPGLTKEERQKRDISFHNTIAKVAGNPVIEELLGSLRLVIAKNVETQEDHVILLNGTRDFHREMVNAISEQNPDRAYEVMTDYFEAVYKFIGI